MRIVVLEGDSVGKDVSWSVLEQFRELKVYPGLRQDEMKDAISGADVIVPNTLKIGSDRLQ